MKLLLDQNLSWRLLQEINASFPGSAQIRLLGMETATDAALWTFARNEGYTIVTKDSDFVELSTLYGPPPKVIWLKLGNVSSNLVRSKLSEHAETIKEFLSDVEDGVLEIE